MAKGVSEFRRGDNRSHGRTAFACCGLRVGAVFAVYFGLAKTGRAPRHGCGIAGAGAPESVLQPDCSGAVGGVIGLAPAPLRHGGKRAA